MPLLRRRRPLFHNDLARSVPGAAGSTPPPLPGGVNPPATWQGWLSGVGHAITPTIAMAHVGADYITAAAKAKAQTGAAWNYCFHTHTTIPKRK